MRVVYGAAEARRSLLRRQPLGETELPPSVRRKNAALFGADLPVEEQVRRIIDDVRREGDAALARYTKAFTGAGYDTFEVGRDEIAAARGEVDPPLIDALREAA
ncbi:MAG: histidinol dehydrogenase, partial [Dehalococcoidia bacterium]